LIAAGLKNINISLDTFDAERFKKITRRDGFDRVHGNILLALEKGCA
jgi:cyclic pyranopterin phosphate synthase